MCTRSTLQRIIAGLAAMVVIAFFLEWATHSAFVDGSTGLDLATTTDSAASGKSLAGLFITPVAAILVGGLAAFLMAFGGRRVWVAVSQMALAVAGVIAALVIVPDELSTWTGGEVGFGYGLWIALIGLGGITMVAFVDAIQRITAPQPVEQADSREDRLLPV